MSGTAGAEPTFIEHVHELRKRLMISLLFLGTGALIGWVLFDRIIQILSSPYGQKLYYSAPTGELSFTIKVCVIFGIVFASPMLFYQVMKFLQPAMATTLRKRIGIFGLLSAVLAISGACFAYFLSLPLTLEFLTNMQSGHGMIEPLISADEYFNFVLAYIAGFAVLFQIPLLVLIVNKMTPLTPSKLFKSFRFVIVLSFVAAAIITPTPDPINQAIMAVPVIVLYFLSAMLLVTIQLLKKKPQPAQVIEAPTLKAKIPQSLATVPQKKQPTSPPLTQLSKQLLMEKAPAAVEKKSPRPQRQFVQDIQRPQAPTPSRPTYARPMQTSRVISDFL